MAQRIVIIGGGAIGCATAYFLTRHPEYDTEKPSITLLEATELAGGASGKAGGCLASWATPTCLADLSFRLHAELAAEHNGLENWGYRRALCLDCETKDEGPGADGELLNTPGNTAEPEFPNWVFPNRLQSVEELGNPSNTGQVHPRLFTRFLASQAEAKGVKIIIGSAVAIGHSDAGAVSSVRYKLPNSGDVEELGADLVILAAGPWTPTLLPNAPIKGSRSHSIVLDVPSSSVPPEILFFNRPHKDSWFPKLEVYPRPDNTAYFCGPTDFDVPLPASTALVDVNKESCQLIRRAAESLSGRFVGHALFAEQACYRPVMTVPGRDRSVGPLVGMTSTPGLLLAAGHDQWGIQNSLGTGKVISELIFEGKVVSADISTLDPKLVLDQQA